MYADSARYFMKATNAENLVMKEKKITDKPANALVLVKCALAEINLNNQTSHGV